MQWVVVVVVAVIIVAAVVAAARSCAARYCKQDEAGNSSQCNSPSVYHSPQRLDKSPEYLENHDCEHVCSVEGHTTLPRPNREQDSTETRTTRAQIHSHSRTRLGSHTSNNDLPHLCPTLWSLETSLDSLGV
jgi:hypothetical protein